MNDFTHWFELSLGLTPETQLKIAETLLTIILLWATNRALGYLLNRSTKNIESRYQWQKAINYFITIVCQYHSGVKRAIK